MYRHPVQNPLPQAPHERHPSCPFLIRYEGSQLSFGTLGHTDVTTECRVVSHHILKDALGEPLNHYHSKTSYTRQQRHQHTPPFFSDLTYVQQPSTTTQHILEQPRYPQRFHHVTPNHGQPVLLPSWLHRTPLRDQAGHVSRLDCTRDLHPVRHAAES
jgi:hypothetical protein